MKIKKTNCSKCNDPLTTANKMRHNICRKCMNANFTAWCRKSGRIKEFPCIICGKLIFRNHGISGAWCSEICYIGCHVNNYNSLTECWTWTGSLRPNGTPAPTAVRSFSLRAPHRITYELFHSPLTRKDTLNQRCGIKHCVSPYHNFIERRKYFEQQLHDGKIAENSKDS
jgi:hypothetical protein